MKRRIPLNYVFRGTYEQIAKRLGYSRQYVARVARGNARNVHIERELIIAVRVRKAHERSLQRIKQSLPRR